MVRLSRNRPTCSGASTQGSISVETVTCAESKVIGSPTPEVLDHYGVAMKDPEGNEFDIA